MPPTIEELATIISALSSRYLLLQNQLDEHLHSHAIEGQRPTMNEQLILARIQHIERRLPPVLAEGE